MPCDLSQGYMTQKSHFFCDVFSAGTKDPTLIGRAFVEVKRQGTGTFGTAVIKS